MITIHASAVCRVRDGYNGQPLEGSKLLCALDGAPVGSTALCFALVNFLLVMAGNLCPGLPFIDRFEKGSEYLPSLLFLILAFSRLL